VFVEPHHFVLAGGRKAESSEASGCLGEGVISFTEAEAGVVFADDPILAAVKICGGL